MTVRIKRIYHGPGPGDGIRILVDRLWPRGVSKRDAALDLWMKNVAPSPQLRIWFDHRADRFSEFSVRYKAELATNPAVDQLRAFAQANPTVTLLYAAKSAEINHAIVLAEFLA